MESDCQTSNTLVRIYAAVLMISEAVNQDFKALCETFKTVKFQYFANQRE